MSQRNGALWSGLAVVGATVVALSACSQSDTAQPPQNALANSASNALTNAPANAAADATSAPGSAITEQIALQSDGGTWRVPALINDSVTLNFTIDSGASVVVIPSDVAQTLAITRDEYIGNQTFTLADGSQVPSPVFRIRSLKVGNLELRNVEASITPQGGDLLLGQSFLSRLASWSIDNQHQALVLTAPAGGLPPSPDAQPTTVATASPDADDNAVSEPSDKGAAQEKDAPGDTD